MDNDNLYQNSNTQLEEPVSIGEWVVTFLLMMIPCVNIVLMFVWAFSKTEKKSKSNYFKVALIVTAVSIVLGVIIGIIMGAAIASAFASNPYFYY